MKKPTYSPQSKILLSILAGLLALLLSRSYITIDKFYNLKFVWSMLLPLLLSMTWGRRFAFYAFFCGGAGLIPFWVSPDLGLGNLLYSALYFGLLAMNDKSFLARRKTPLLRNIYIANIGFGLLEYTATLLLLPPLLHLNPLLRPEYLRIGIAPTLLKIHCINGIISYFLMVVFAELLLEFNIVRAVLELPPLPHARRRYTLGGTAFALMAGFILFDSLVDSFYFSAKGLHVSLFMRSTGGYTRLISISIFFCVTVKIIIDSICKIDELNTILESHIEDRTNQLKEAYSDLESYSYTVSHELKTPLREISAYTGFIQEDCQNLLPPQSRKDLGAIQKLCTDTADMIEKMMMYSKAGYSAMNREPIDMRQMIRDCLDELRKSYGSHPIHADIQAMPVLMADRFLIKQAIFNVLSNAVKFSMHKPETEITVGCAVGTTRETYFIRDNGVGFEMQYSGKLFGLFDTVHNRSDFEGSGIGLATVKKIVDRHQGTVDIYAEKGKGCIVMMSFPIEPTDCTQGGSAKM